MPTYLTEVDQEFDTGGIDDERSRLRSASARGSGEGTLPALTVSQSPPSRSSEKGVTARGEPNPSGRASAEFPSLASRGSIENTPRSKSSMFRETYFWQRMAKSQNGMRVASGRTASIDHSRGSSSGRPALATLQTPNSDSKVYPPPNKPKPTKRPRSGHRPGSRTKHLKPLPDSPKQQGGGAARASPRAADDSPKRGTLYKFRVPCDDDSWPFPVPDRTEERHFDYCFNELCEWDKGEPVLDLSELSSNAVRKFQRTEYTWRMQSAKDPVFEFQKATWERIQQDKTVAVEDLARWAANIRPRSIHDFKPMLVLTQGVLRVMLEKELDFFSEEKLDLKHKLQVQEGRVAELEEEVRGLKKQSNLASIGNIGSRMSMIGKERVAQKAATVKLSQAEQRAEDLRKMQLAQQQQAMQDMLDKESSSAKATIDELEQDNNKLHKVCESLRVKTKEQQKRINTLRNEASSAKDEAQRLREVKEREDAERLAKDDMEGLGLLFHPDYGTWRNVTDFAMLKRLAEAAQAHIHERYGGYCELTKIAYNPMMDDDEMDDPDTYNDNVLEVVGSHEPGRLGHQILPATHPYLFQCANARKLVEITPDGALLVDGEAPAREEAEEGSAAAVLAGRKGALESLGSACLPKEHTMCAPVIEVLAQGERRPLPEVWGVLEARVAAEADENKTGPGGCKLRTAITYAAEGLSRLTQRLRELEHRTIAELKKAAAQAKWQLARDQQSVMIRKKLKTEDKLVSLMGQMNHRQRKMEEYKVLQRTLYMLEEQRSTIDKIMDSESSRCAMAQIKAYKVPTHTTINVIMCLYTVLGYDSLWKQCPFIDGTRQIPRDSKEQLGLWKAMIKVMNTNKIMQQMKKFDPATVATNGPFVTWETGRQGEKINVTKQKCDTINQLLYDVPLSAAQDASFAAGLCHQWCGTMMLFGKCYEKLKAVEKEMGDTGKEFKEEEREQQQAADLGPVALQAGDSPAASKPKVSSRLSGRAKKELQGR